MEFKDDKLNFQNEKTQFKYKIKLLLFFFILKLIGLIELSKRVIVIQFYFYFIKRRK